MKKLESRCFTNEKTVKKAQKNKLGKYKKKWKQISDFVLPFEM